MATMRRARFRIADLEVAPGRAGTGPLSACRTQAPATNDEGPVLRTGPSSFRRTRSMSNGGAERLVMRL